MSAPRPAHADLTAVDRIAAAVDGCTGVAGLHGGPFGEVATYLPGRQVAGVRVTGDPADPARLGLVQVHVTGRYPVPVSEIGGQVRAAVDAVVAGQQVVVTIEDYV